MARNTSTAYKEQIKRNRKYCLKVVITYTDGTIETLTELKDFMKIKVEDACSGTNEFEIGAAIINEVVVALNNREGKFEGKSFYGASVAVYTGIYVNGLPEYLKMGIYIVDEPVAPGATINLVAYDNMVKTDKQYVPGIIFPATNAQIAEDACAQCGIILKTMEFPNSDYIVANAPEEKYSCREILSFVAEIGACFVRCDANGDVEIRWYSEEVNHEISGLSSKNICTDTVTITGIDVLSGNETIASTGEDGYKLSIKDNALIQEGTEQDIADFIAEKLVGFSFRPLSVTCRNDASIEAGDKVRVVDEKGNMYETLVTSTTFTMMDKQKVECNAASPIVNSSERLSDTAKAIIETKKYTQEQVNKEKTAREKALEEMSGRIAKSSGLFMTEKKQEDGSTIYYGHDKQKLEDSTFVWKFGIEAMGISTDGGKTYPYGLDVSGTAILNRIYTVGLNADYITSGTFVAKDKEGNIVFSVNVETGEVYVKANSFSVHTVKINKGVLITKFDGSDWSARYVDVNEVEISSLYFDFEQEKFIFNGAGHFTGSINVNDKFIVDVNGNVSIYGGRYYAMDEEGNISSFTSMDKDGFTVYSKDGIPAIKIGFPDGNTAYPYVRLNSGENTDEQSGIVKKFANGMWIGNDAPSSAYGYFEPKIGYNGMFIDFDENKTYIVAGTDMQNVYTGESIARFG